MRTWRQHEECFLVSSCIPSEPKGWADQVLGSWRVKLVLLFHVIQPSTYHVCVCVCPAGKPLLLNSFKTGEVTRNWIGKCCFSSMFRWRNDRFHVPSMISCSDASRQLPYSLLHRHADGAVIFDQVRRILRPTILPQTPSLISSHDGWLASSSC